MAVTRRQIAVSPGRVFAVLSDADAYGEWVVGSSTIRGVEGRWPAPGSRFHHRVGVGPLKVHDHTEVLECDSPWRLVLQARARPLATARVELVLDEQDGGTLVTMRESAGHPLSRLVLNRLTDPVTDARNRVSLQRLERLAMRAGV